MHLLTELGLALINKRYIAVLDHVLHALFERDDQQRHKVDEQNGPEHGHVQEAEQCAG